MKRELFFSFVAQGEGVAPALYHTDTTPRDINRALTQAGVDTDYREGADALDDCDYADVWESFDPAEFATVDGSGILPARAFFAMLDDMGVVPERCGTMGTLGGPLGGHVPDLAWTTESQLLVLSLRATPVLKIGDAYHALSGASWERMRRVCWECDPWRVAKGNLSELAPA